MTLPSEQGTLNKRNDRDTQARSTHPRVSSRSYKAGPYGLCDMRQMLAPMPRLACAQMTESSARG